MAERVVTGVEVRTDIDSRTISGVAMPYGQVSPSHRERFVPGSLQPVGDTWLDVGHDMERLIAWRGAGLTFTDTPDALRFEARLPRTPLADRALQEVESGTRRGVSVEFTAEAEHREAQTGVRVVEDALLHGIGLVARAAYPSAQVETRQAATMEGVFRLAADVLCRCRDGCDSVFFRADSLDTALAQAARGEREVHLFLSGKFNEPLASVGRGLELTRDGNELRVRATLPETQAVADFLKARLNGFFALRLWVPREAPFEKQGKQAIYGPDSDLRGIEIAAIAGRTDGYEEIDVLDIIEERRVPIWL